MPRAILMVLLAALLPLLSGSVTPVGAAEPGVRSFRELGYGDLTARTMYGSLDYFFPLPKGYLPQPESRLELVFSHSPLLTPDRSTLTVLANGQSLASVFLTGENRSRARLVVPLPVEGFAGAGFFVQVQLSQRLTRESCEETQNPALWTTVHGDSLIILPTELSPSGFDLKDIEALFTPLGPQAAPVTVVLPERPGPEELEAAGLVAYQLGRWAARAGRDIRLVVSDAAGPEGPAVAVGLGANLGLREAWGSLRWGPAGFSASGRAIPEQQGVLALARAPAPRLLISGATPAGLRAATQALRELETASPVAGDHLVATGAQLSRVSTAPWRQGAASFAQLGIAERRLAGPGEHTLQLPLERPMGWLLQGGSALELAIQASPAVVSEDSWVAARVNTLELGVQRLRPEEGRMRFPLPADLLNADLQGQPQRRLDLQLRVFLALKAVGCTQAAPESAWAVVLTTSAWLLHHESFTGMDLGRFPAPLFGGAAGAPLSVVLPEQPNRLELEAALQSIAALARWTPEEPAHLPQLTTFDRLSEQERRDRHLLVVGVADRFSRSAEGGRLAAVLSERPPPWAYQALPGERRGWLLVAGSPWGRERLALAVTADQPAGLSLAAAALTNSALMGQLRGRTSAIVEGLPPQPVALAEPAPQVPSALTPRVELPLTQRLPAWQVVGAVLLGALVGVLVVVGLTRWRRSSS